MGKITYLNNDNFQSEALGAGVVLVDFYADWCGPCKMIAPVLEELAAEFDGRAKICKVDVDNNDELASKYGIRSIPTLIIFKNGQEAEKSVGFSSKEALKAKIEKFL